LKFKEDQRNTFVLIVAMLIGVLAAFGAIGFRTMILETQKLFFLSKDHSISFLENLAWWKRLLLPSLGGLLVGIIVNRFATEVKGSGIPEVMESVAKKSGFVRGRVLIVKAIAAAITIGSGGSAGREGPIVHIGSAIGSAIGQFLKVSARHMRTFVACGAAAGIAATFNAPIAGALFSLEVILGEMQVISMSAIVLSSVVAAVVSRHFLGDFPAFSVVAYEMISYREFLVYASLGVASGLVSAAFIYTLGFSRKFFDGLKINPIIKPAIGGFLVGVIALWVPHVFGVGYETINASLHSKLPLLILLVVLFAKIAATSLTLGSGGSGGIFAPALFIGATLGALFGDLGALVFPGFTAPAGAYALVGMGGVVAAVTHAPISAILIIFELTNNYQVFPPLMLTCVLGVMISTYLSPNSIYLSKLVYKGINLREKRDINLLKGIKVSEIMECSPLIFNCAVPFDKISKKLLVGKQPFLFVEDNDGQYLGSIELNDIREMVPDQKLIDSIIVAKDVARNDIPYVLKDDNLDVVLHIIGKMERSAVAVVDNSTSRKIIGYVTRTSVIDEYNRMLFKQDLSGGFSSIMDAIDKGRTIEILGEMHIGEIDIPSNWIGKTIREIDIRRKKKLEIVLIHRDIAKTEKGIDGRPAVFPAPDVVLNAGDRLLVLGKPVDIRGSFK